MDLPRLPALPEDPGLDPDALDFSEVMGELLRDARLRDSEEVCSYGITLTECYGLEALVRKGPLTVNEFARALRLDKSTASRAVSSLETKGYARRRPDARDGRALQLQATPSGVRLYRRIKRGSLACYRGILAGVDPTARRAATKLLRRLTASLSASCGDPSGRAA